MNTKYNYNTYNNFKISKMDLNDSNLISDIFNTSFDDFWDINTLNKELLTENSQYLCVKDINTNTIVGFCGIKINLDTADLMNIAIKKDFRNLGIGSFLLNSIINLCKNQKNISSIFLEVNENNINAINLYKKYNFKKISIRKNYYKNENAIIMLLNLNEKNNTKN